jgi:hypothetical protein
MIDQLPILITGMVIGHFITIILLGILWSREDQ